MAVKNLTSNDLEDFIKTGVSVIDFHADWCAPCRILSPIVEDVSKELKDVKFGKVDVDKESKLAQRFHVMSVPTLIFFKKGKQVDRTIGVLEREKLTKKLEEIK